MIIKNTFPSYSDVYSQLQQVSVHNVNGGVGRGFGVEFAQKPAAKKNLQK